MADGAPHILNITQQLQASLNLYLFLKVKYANNQKFKSMKFDKTYFENILKAIQSAESTNLKDQMNEAQHNFDPMAK